MKCNKTQSKWCIKKHGASKIIDTFETYQSLGSIRLSDPINSGLSTRKTASVARSESSVGSSSEVNSPVSFKPMKYIKDTVEELDKIMENLSVEELDKIMEPSGHSDKSSNESLDTQ
jgi:hypothetical protein